jgi:hypothetical protein
VVRRPADATVAKVVGYDNVIPVETDRTGEVLIGGAPSGLPAVTPGAGTLAASGAAIRITPPGCGPLQAAVERVSPGPGRWELILSAGETLRAHLPLDEPPPHAGERVAVHVDPAHATLIAGRHVR